MLDTYFLSHATDVDGHILIHSPVITKPLRTNVAKAVLDDDEVKQYANVAKRLMLMSSKVDVFHPKTPFMVRQLLFNAMGEQNQNQYLITTNNAVQAQTILSYMNMAQNEFLQNLSHVWFGLTIDDHTNIQQAQTLWQKNRLSFPANSVKWLNIRNLHKPFDLSEWDGIDWVLVFLSEKMTNQDSIATAMSIRDMCHDREIAFMFEQQRSDQNRPALLREHAYTALPNRFTEAKAADDYFENRIPQAA